MTNMRRGNPKTRRHHAYETAIEMLLEADEDEWISQWTIVETCNKTHTATRKEYTEKEIGNFMATPVKAGSVEKRRVRVAGFGQTQYRLLPVDWKQVDIVRKPNLETWAGLLTKNAGTTLTTS